MLILLIIFAVLYVAGELNKKYVRGQITPSQFALEPQEQIKYGLNIATWYIGSKVSTKHSDNFSEERLLRNDTHGRNVLDLAKRRLSSMDFVGLTSRFGESMEIMSWKLGIPMSRYCSCNVNMFKPATHERNLTYEANERIERLNCLDMELYDHARKIFDSRLAAYHSATRLEERVPFDCDIPNGTCTKSMGKTGVQSVPISTIKKAPEQLFRNGEQKSECSYECYRRPLERGLE